MITGAKNVKNEHLFYLGASQFACVIPPSWAIPGAAKVTAIQIRKMEHLKLLVSDYKERAGFIFLGRKREMFCGSFLRLKSKKILQDSEVRKLADNQQN